MWSFLIDHISGSISANESNLNENYSFLSRNSCILSYTNIKLDYSDLQVANLVFYQASNYEKFSIFEEAQGKGALFPLMCTERFLNISEKGN